MIAADLSSAAEVARLAAEAGEVDVLVGERRDARRPVGSRPSRWRRSTARSTSTCARPIVLSHALLPGMLERRRGHLVFISSIAGKTTVPGDPLYHATKYGLRGFAAAMRMDLHGTGVSSSCVFPGFIHGAGIFADSGAKLPPGVGTRSPEDVADAVAVHDRARPRRESRSRPSPSVRAPASRTSHPTSRRPGSCVPRGRRPDRRKWTSRCATNAEPRPRSEERRLQGRLERPRLGVLVGVVPRRPEGLLPPFPFGAPARPAARAPVAGA